MKLMYLLHITYMAIIKIISLTFLLGHADGIVSFYQLQWKKGVCVCGEGSTYFYNYNNFILDINITISTITFCKIQQVLLNKY